METVDIAGIKVPISKIGNNSGGLGADLVETDSTIRNLQNILYPILEGRPVLLVGDAGVGKNALLYYINFKRNHPTSRFSFNEDTLPEDLIGSYRLLLDGKGFAWADGPLTSAIRSGYSFVADEMNLCPPHIIKRFSTIYESSYLELIEGDGARIPAFSGFNFIGTQNPSEGFEGRKPLPFDITRYFSVVYIDPHTPDEILFILRKLYPQMKEEILKSCIRISLETENRVLLGTIGKGDLEKYHFNIRNLKKLCKRILDLKADSPEFRFRELWNFYVEPFRKPEDRQQQLELLLKETGLSSAPEFAEGKFQVHKGFLYCNDKKIHVVNEENAKNILSSVPLPNKLREFAEKVYTAIEFKENVLIEYSEEQDPQFVLPLFTEISGVPLETVHLCKGIHTSDIIGALKPISGSTVGWVDGPLTKGIREGGNILITNLEAAGAELVEKLNMLTDDARSLVLPPESGETTPIGLQEDSRVIAMKLFRKTKSTPTISRAFRNRFTPVLFPELEDKETLIEILNFYLPEGDLVSKMAEFHVKIKDLAKKRTIGSANLMPYLFGLSNLLQWKDHILRYADSSSGGEGLRAIAIRGGRISYSNQIADPGERKELERILEFLLSGIEIVSEFFTELEEKKKKTLTPSSEIEKKRWWDPELHKRDPVTGKAKLLNSGNQLKQGIEINTPETGGQTKEGPDAWYGKDTRGNMGQGEPAGGGGAWGYRTEELYKAFLAKRRILWEYTVQASLKEFKEVFGASLDEVELNLERLFDPEIDIHRNYRSEGNRIDTRKYISFLSGKGDSKVFDKTTIEKDEEKLKGVEVVFLVSKARRIFNFEYSVATLSAMLSSAHILDEHDVSFSVIAYSDRQNKKDRIDLVEIKRMDESFDAKKEEQMFDALRTDWQGDSIEEYQLLDKIESYFSPEAQTRILVMISDFRGQRGKTEIEKEIDSKDNRKLRAEVLKHSNKNYVFLGVGLGRRFIAEHIFPDSIQITSENFYNMPNLIGAELGRIILTHHSSRN
ncbi:ATPase [Leptospira perolatii]|uniref:ATPase n=1 Tax=Leptospira perolatii TaxID=2023191 RepID=A0A2M9ZL04_9LEPT|nr:vWA domain-containing protein [Leptospira perolatii]PJZ70354.1 ATPase [Leptospira perolatii]PJZ72762.1 ATPase [Leptospira perolatii]